MLTSALEAILKKDRAVGIGGLVMVILLSWVYTVLGIGMHMSAWEMTLMTLTTTDPAGMETMAPATWNAGYAVLMILMWWIMMIAMMLPSAAPAILLFSLYNHRRQEKGASWVATSDFAAGYVAVWGGFSLLAVAAQWALERTGLLSAMMSSTSLALGGGLLIAGGLWQLTPFKHACLKRCRDPIQFIAHGWRPGRFGAFHMGVNHGAFCLGCCWVLMLLLFYGGVMNLIWIAGLAAFVLLEKTIPRGHWLGRASGVFLIGWGGFLLLV